MNYLTTPKKLQFEISSTCNALCLGCVRTDSNHYNTEKYLIPDKQYLPFDTFKKILTAPEFQTVTELEFCGTIDEPLMHPQLLEFLEFASTVKEYNIIIHTNASLRNEDYWRKLAEVLLKNHKHIVKFSVDGLEDTNHIYRQNTNWDKIMKNAQAFIGAGGKASWQYLIFPWNEHQIMEAKELSIKMGFHEFMSRHDRSRVTNVGLQRIQALKLHDKQTQKIGKPIKWKYPYATVEDINEKLNEQVVSEIECNNQKQGMYFIGYDSRLWPCCFLHNGQFDYDEDKRDLLKKRLFDAYGSDDWNDLSKFSVGEVLSKDFYKFDLLGSWESTEHNECAGSRIHRCTETCASKKLKELPIGGYKVL